MRCRITWFLLLLVLAATASSRDCTPVEAKAAEEQVNQLNSWLKVHRAFVQFGHCDDGGVAEGYSDVVATLLARHWDQLAELGKLVDRDHRFEVFVLRHVDETANLDDLRAVSKFTTESCPAGRRKLCDSIGLKIAHVTKDAT